MSVSDMGYDIMIDEIQQMQNKKGPYYDKWLRHYRQAVEGGKCGGDSRYVQGMKSFLSEAEKEQRKIKRTEGSKPWQQRTTKG